MGAISILLMLFAGIGFAGLAIGMGKLVSTKRRNPVKGDTSADFPRKEHPGGSLT